MKKLSLLVLFAVLLAALLPKLSLGAEPTAASSIQLLKLQAEALKSSRIAPVMEEAIIAIPSGDSLTLQCCIDDGGSCACAPPPNPVCRFYPYRWCNGQGGMRQKRSILDGFLK